VQALCSIPTGEISNGWAIPISAPHFRLNYAKRLGSLIPREPFSAEGCPAAPGILLHMIDTPGSGSISNIAILFISILSEWY
jgi:hypothetical protein